jgi:hypothetical protein
MAIPAAGSLAGSLALNHFSRTAVRQEPHPTAKKRPGFWLQQSDGLSPCYSHHFDKKSSVHLSIDRALLLGRFLVLAAAWATPERC